MATTQAERLLYLSTPLGGEFLLINKLTGREAISELFRFELEVLHEENEEGYKPTPVDPKALLGKPLVVHTKQDDGGERYFNGLCIAFHQGKRDPRFSFYRAVIVPDVWMLTRSTQSRIFQNKSVTDVLNIVLKGFRFDIEISQKLQPRNYIVQYRETDWDFISRLMEEEGIYYYFEHKADENRLIIADSPQSHRICPSKEELPYQVDISELGEDWVGGVHDWLFESRLQVGKLELRDYNFELQNNTLQTTQTSRFPGVANDFTEYYEMPGGYAKRFDNINISGGEVDSVSKVFSDRERTSRIRQEQMDMEFRTVSSRSDSAALIAGYRFKLTTHPMESNNIYQIVVSSDIFAQQAPAYVTDADVPDAYVNEFVCMPHGQGHAPFRPQMVTPRPVVAGSQTAIVVGPPGEEIFPDKYGRVKVHFHWDRISQFDPEASCWLRVSTGIAGKSWGTVFIPRVGQEVIVDFLEGDPDRPIITGCVYNPESMPPYELPKFKTMSTIKTMSTPNASGFNELRFEDKAGDEQIFVHAEKNVDVRVKNDVMETIKHDRHLIVENDQYEKVKKDKHLTVEGDHNEKIKGTMSLTVDRDQQEKVGSNHALEAGSSIHLKAGMSAVIEAGTSLTLKVGGNFININPGGIFIKGTMVMLNSGGAAGTGAGSSPDAPKDPKEADNAIPGNRNPLGRPVPPHKPVIFSPMSLSMQEASRNGTPFCEICAKQQQQQS